MNLIKTMILGDAARAGKNGVLWNMIASLLYSLQSAVLLLVVTRSAGLVDGGIFTICYTVTQMFTTVGSYGMRDFQVSDAKDTYGFATYYTSRLVTVGLMVMTCMGYALIRGYTGQKLLLIAILCVYRIVEDVEDVFDGHMQKVMRLDVAARIQAWRLIGAMVVFAAVFLVTKDLTAACVALTVSAAVLSFVFVALSMGTFPEMRCALSATGLFPLLRQCLPLCLGGFLYNYLVNAPKYAIDRNLNEEMQTVFNILFMPIFAVNMLSMFIFKPLVAKMGVLWNTGEEKKLVGMILKQCLWIVLITVTLCAAGFVAGCPVLGAIYGTDLSAYRAQFVLLIAFGGIAAFVAFFVVVLTIIRRQWVVIVAYAVGSLMEGLLVDRVVARFGLHGAGWMYGAGMGAVCLILLAACLWAMHFGGKERE